MPSLVSDALAAQVEEEAYQLKPMNCPFHVLMYRNTPRSYKSLPLRSAPPAPLPPRTCLLADGHVTQPQSMLEHRPRLMRARPGARLCRRGAARPAAQQLRHREPRRRGHVSPPQRRPSCFSQSPPPPCPLPTPPPPAARPSPPW